MTTPSRALTSTIFECVFSYRNSDASSPSARVLMTTTGQPFVNQRVRPVLHLARRIPLGVNVGNLLQLQRAFERDREVDPAAQVEEVLRRGRTLSPAPPTRPPRSAGCSILTGNSANCCARSRASSREARRAIGRDRARTDRAPTICDVKALVDATPISGPACVRIVPSDSRGNHRTLHVADRQNLRSRASSPRAARRWCRPSRPTARSR